MDQPGPAERQLPQPVLDPRPEGPVEPGRRVEQVLSLQIPSEWTSNSAPADEAATVRRKQYFKDIVTRVQQIPGIASAAITTVLPLGNVMINTRVFLPGRPDQPIRPAYRGVTPDYFRTMGIPILRGRAFTEDDRTGAPPVVIATIRPVRANATSDAASTSSVSPE